jgi:hypothetical protein
MTNMNKKEINMPKARVFAIIMAILSQIAYTGDVVSITTGHYLWNLPFSIGLTVCAFRTFMFFTYVAVCGDW